METPPIGTPEPAPSLPPLRPAPEPLPPDASALHKLIRAPEALLGEVESRGGTRMLGVLLLLALGGHLAYGLVLGSFTGGMQWWASPLKSALGAALVGAICLPSLFIFSVFSGADVRGRHVLGLVLGQLALTGVFLAGFAPVAWVFTQSSTLVSFAGAIHLLVWFVSMVAGGRVVHASLRHWKARTATWATLWVLILVLTAAQMMTTLRPLVGSGEELFQSERRFFLQHWVLTMQADARR